MERAAQVPGLWTPGFLLFWAACVLVWIVLGLGFRLRPATPSWGFGVCLCFCARSACTPPLLAGVLGCACLCARSACTPPLLAAVCAVGVCAWAGVSAAPRDSWRGRRGVCVLVCALRLYPTSPGCGVRCGWVCLGSGFGCAPSLLAGVLGCVCDCVRAPLVPRQSWLGCALWVHVFGLGFRLRPAAPGWGVGVCVFVCALHLYSATPGCGMRCGCVCLGSGFCYAPPLLALLLGCVCVGVRAPLVHRHSRLGCAAWECLLGRASLACLMALQWCAAPRPHRSLPLLLSAFPTLWCLSPSRGLAPPDLPGGCAGHVEAGREPGSLCLPLAPAEAGARFLLRVVPVRGPAMRLSLAGPSGVGIGLRVLRRFACVDPVTPCRRVRPYGTIILVGQMVHTFCDELILLKLPGHQLPVVQPMG